MIRAALWLEVQLDIEILFIGKMDLRELSVAWKQEESILATRLLLMEAMCFSATGARFY